jgi:hypothetical protein
MPKIIVTAEVEDFAKWEKSFRTHRDLFKQMAVSKMEYAAQGNRVAVCGETTNLDAFMKVLSSSATTEAMKADGVKRETVQTFVLDKAVTV